VLKSLGRRLVWIVPIILIVTFFVFALLDLAPGDAARTVAGTDADAATVAAVRHKLNLDEPLIPRYAEWISGAAHGDLGTSLVTNQSVGKMVFDAVPATVSLTLVALVLACVFAIIFGAGPVIWRWPWLDRVSTAVCSLSIALPSFWIALLLTAWFAVDRQWLPALGYVPLTENPWEWLRHLILPATALGLATAGELARQLRGALDDVFEQDYALALRAKGLPHRRIVLKHGLKNAAVPVITVLGVRIAQLLAGTVIIEQIFLIDGLGRLTVTAVLGRDIPVVLGVVLVATVIVLIGNLIVDASYGYFNPRLRQS
jgi:peptide/nickel transport system permease protein